MYFDVTSVDKSTLRSGRLMTASKMTAMKSDCNKYCKKIIKGAARSKKKSKLKNNDKKHSPRKLQLLKKLESSRRNAREHILVSRV